MPHALKTVWPHELFFASHAPIALFGSAFSFSFSIFDDVAGFTENTFHETTGLYYNPTTYKSFVKYTISYFK